MIITFQIIMLLAIVIGFFGIIAYSNTEEGKVYIGLFLASVAAFIINIKWL